MNEASVSTGWWNNQRILKYPQGESKTSGIVLKSRFALPVDCTTRSSSPCWHDLWFLNNSTPDHIYHIEPLVMHISTSWWEFLLSIIILLSLQHIKYVAVLQRLHYFEHNYRWPGIVHGNTCQPSSKWQGVVFHNAVSTIILRQLYSELKLKANDSAKYAWPERYLLSCWNLCLYLIP